jgi:hypothetical protein
VTDGRCATCGDPLRETGWVSVSDYFCRQLCQDLWHQKRSVPLPDDGWISPYDCWSAADISSRII